MKSNPQNYQTQTGLINALTRASEMPMTVNLAWWFKNAKYALVHQWGWEEEEAAKFVAGYHPRTSAYHATS